MSQGEVDGITKRSKKALVERMLGGELTHHLGYPPGGEKPPDASNHRNGTSGKTVLTEEGPLRLDIPRDRAGTFEPQLIGKHERRFAGFGMGIERCVAWICGLEHVRETIPYPRMLYRLYP